MARFLRKTKDTIGLSPDTIHFIGKKHFDSFRIRSIDYSADELKEESIVSPEDVGHYQETTSTSWLNIDGLHDIDMIEKISDIFDLDPLIIADVVNTDQRPKITEYDNCVYISVKMLKYDKEKEQIDSENLVLIIKENILLSFQEKPGDVFDPVRERIRNNKKRIRNSGTDYLAFALIDVVVDNYLYLISVLGENIENMDEHISSKDTTIPEKIAAYKNDIIYMKKAIRPAREMIYNLAKLDSEFLDKSNSIHFNELLHNINLAIESLDNYRELLSDQLNIYNTCINNRLNDILKFLTIFSVIFIPLTFIAGIYGTNFDYIPELSYKYSYFIMLGVMSVIALVMIFIFKRKKWF